MNLSESNANVDLLCQVLVVEAVVVFNRGAVTVSGLSRRGWWVTFVLLQRAKCKSKGGTKRVIELKNNTLLIYE